MRMPLRPAHATSVTLGSAYTTKPYLCQQGPLLFGAVACAKCLCLIICSLVCATCQRGRQAVLRTPGLLDSADVNEQQVQSSRQNRRRLETDDKETEDGA